MDETLPNLPESEALVDRPPANRVGALMSVDLIGRVNNLGLPRSRPLMPLFEAVINSLHAVESLGAKGRVDVHLTRDRSQQLIEKVDRDYPVTGFRVVDNGHGFDDPNFESFCKSDSQHKRARGGKGVGRFLWLKSFEKVHVTSAYRGADSAPRRRAFSFVLAAEPFRNYEDEPAQDEPTQTTVSLIGLKDDLQRACPKRLATIAMHTLEHCLPLLLNGPVPRVFVHDDDGSALELGALLRAQYSDRVTESDLTIQGHMFRLFHMRNIGQESNAHRIAYYANHREVLSEPIKRFVPSMAGPLRDDGDDFYWTTYVFGDYLDQHVDAVRSSFNFPTEDEEVAALLPDAAEVTLRQIRSGIVDDIRSKADAYLRPIRDETQRRVDRILEETNPEYRILKTLAPGFVDAISPNATDEEMVAVMHRAKYAVERQARQEVREILDAAPEESGAALEKRVAEAFAKVNAISMGDLAKYVIHRRVVLDLLQRNIQPLPDGEFPYEQAFHSLVAPQQLSSDEVHEDALNLWVIDERLTFHRVMTSDVPTTTRGRAPDILVAKAPPRPDRYLLTDDEHNASVVVIVEFKRPMRDDYGRGKNPVQQIIDYVADLEAGTGRVAGRPLVVNKATRFEAYLICDVTPPLAELLNREDGVTDDTGRGWVVVRKNLRLTIEVVPFEVLLKRARQRNQVFFSKLGI